MQAREAKDFLVEQTAEQAQLEGVPFSDLERRMMYFTEIEEMPEDPIKLNKEFEAEYDSDEYEAKISKLLHHAYARIKKENPEAARQWSEAILELGKGDHYILVLLNEGSLTWSILRERPPHDSLKLLAAGLGVAVLVVIAAFIPVKFGPQLQAHSHLLFGIFITIVLAGCFFPRRIGIVGSRTGRCSAFWNRRRAKKILTRFPAHFRPRSFSNSDSVRMVTPSSLALSYFDPGSVPTTT
jgi:hypothetical protein